MVNGLTNVINPEINLLPKNRNLKLKKVKKNHNYQVKNKIKIPNVFKLRLKVQKRFEFDLEEGRP